MLGIDPAGFTRRDVEELGVEFSDIIQETTTSGVHFPGFAIGTIKPVNVPTVVRDIADGIDAVQQVLPEFTHVACARKAATHADDGDVVPLGSLPGRLANLGSLLRLLRSGGATRRFCGGSQFQHVIGDGVDGGMIEQHGWAHIELVAQHLLQFRTEFDRHQRIESHFDQGSVSLGRLGCRQDPLQRFPDCIDQQFATSLALQFLQLADKGRIDAA